MALCPSQLEAHISVAGCSHATVGGTPDADGWDRRQGLAALKLHGDLVDLCSWTKPLVMPVQATLEPQGPRIVRSRRPVVASLKRR